MNKYIDIFENEISHILRDKYRLRESKEVPHGVGFELRM